MPAPYSPDLRLRVMDAVRSGMSYADVTRRFRVSNSTILRWVRRLRESGSYAALPMGGKKPFVLADERDWLLQRFAAKPDLTLREVLAELHDRGIEVGYFALPSVPMMMRHQPPGSLPLRASGDTSKWLCRARQIKRSLQPLALEPRQAVGRRWFQRQRLRRLNFRTGPAAAHSRPRTSCAFSAKLTARRASPAGSARSCGARGSIRQP